MCFISAVLNKYTVILSNAMSGDNLPLVQKYQPEGWFLSVGSMIQCSHAENIESYDCSSVRIVVTGGEVVLEKVMKTFLDKVVGADTSFLILYGITEGGIIANTSSDDVTLLGKKLPPGVFLDLYPGVNIKILDEEGNPVAPGSLGEMWLKAVGMTPGYWSLPELNRKVFDKDGYFCTGDAAFCDSRGVLFHRGRVDDLITYRGVKIPPAEIEEVLMSHPAVLEAAVIGRSHPVDTQHATAYVVRKPGVQVSEEEISAFVDGQVDDLKRLRGGVHLVDGLPRIAIGKIIRKELRN
uniref:AMP-dependent synthetase/ligase domain-containing protein n=2 Tax=Graphocephala atropunctata TaxID=36148 RepID=A0A1B6KR62_9HEMI